jgi:hypothetical protein
MAGLYELVRVALSTLDEGLGEYLLTRSWFNDDIECQQLLVCVVERGLGRNVNVFVDSFKVHLMELCTFKYG